MKQIFGLFLFILFANFVLAQTIEFQVDMGVQAAKGQFTIGDPVKIAGNFNGWNNGADVMTDTDGDTIYTITKTFNVGDTLLFKFIKGDDGWESISNRVLIVLPAATLFQLILTTIINMQCRIQLMLPFPVTWSLKSFPVVSTLQRIHCL